MADDMNIQGAGSMGIGSSQVFKTLSNPFQILQQQRRQQAQAEQAKQKAELERAKLNQQSLNYKEGDFSRFDLKEINQYMKDTVDYGKSVIMNGGILATDAEFQKRIHTAQQYQKASANTDKALMESKNFKPHKHYMTDKLYKDTYAKAANMTLEERADFVPDYDNPDYYNFNSHAADFVKSIKDSKIESSTAGYFGQGLMIKDSESEFKFAYRDKNGKLVDGVGDVHIDSLMEDENFAKAVTAKVTREIDAKVKQYKEQNPLDTRSDDEIFQQFLGNDSVDELAREKTRKILEGYQTSKQSTKVKYQNLPQQQKWQYDAAKKRRTAEYRMKVVKDMITGQPGALDRVVEASMASNNKVKITEAKYQGEPLEPGFVDNIVNEMQNSGNPLISGFGNFLRNASQQGSGIVFTVQEPTGEKQTVIDEDGNTVNKPVTRTREIVIDFNDVSNIENQVYRLNEALNLATGDKITEEDLIDAWTTGAGITPQEALNKKNLEEQKKNLEEQKKAKTKGQGGEFDNIGQQKKGEFDDL